MVEELSHQEALVERYADQNKTDTAVKLLFDLIVKHAKAGDFKKAEALREWLMEIEAMALAEIIRSAEIIEEEKSKSREGSEDSIWKDLYCTLSVEEANALYLSLEKAVYDPECPIYRQGDRDANLYFVHRGHLKLIYVKDGRENLLETFVAGEIAGTDNFFSVTLCTASLVPISAVEVGILKSEVLDKWRDNFPGLEGKLREYCASQEKRRETSKKKHFDRRSEKRTSIFGDGIVQLTDFSANPIGKPFRGDLVDIGTGGLCLNVRIMKKEAARLLLGRSLKVDFNLPSGGTLDKTSRTGKIVALHFLPFGDCAVHVKFDGSHE